AGSVPGALSWLPVLVVDEQGVRLGGGAGCYDRFVTRFGHTGPKFLLCPEALVFPALPTDEWDVPFTPGEILTENGVK
ncbi:MAG: 5-formyltetrahydrofolate cyclo-ligase, partial [Gemmiger sp.]|nr:5-formyltetrahydrofolate cyclo-ligase [Gemmiger sp.]